MIVSEDSRRLLPRIGVETPVTLVEVASGARRTVLLSDLSGGGMSFHTDRAVAVGAEIEVAIVPSLAVTPPLYARGRVLRCGPDDGQFRVAVVTESMDTASTL
jgi:hypothetical protein